MLTTSFEHGILKVYKDDKQIIEQPFHPANDGTQNPWVDENEALNWLANSAMLDMISAKEEKEEFIKALNLGE